MNMPEERAIATLWLSIVTHTHMNMQQGSSGPRESKYQSTGHNGCYSLSVCAFWLVHSSVSTRGNSEERVHACVQSASACTAYSISLHQLHAGYMCSCVACCFVFFCTLFLRHTCLLACVHAEAAAKAIVKCNGMTLLSWQFVVTACLSAWLDGCCTWETRLSHAIARLDWMSCINLQYLFLQILQCHALYLTFFRSLVCSFMHTSCTYFVVSRAHIWVPPNWTAKLSRLSTETLATILRSFSSKTSLWCFSFPLFYIFVRGIFSSF